MNEYLPEGKLMGTKQNAEALADIDSLKAAARSGQILEARALMCDRDHNIIVRLPCCKGFIPRSEGALGIDDGTTRDVALLSRVNKPVCFKVTAVKEYDGEYTAILSRRQAQLEARERYVSGLSAGDVIAARVTHLEPFGCFVDVGCGIPSLIPIDAISVSRISHPCDRFKNGQDIFAVVKNIEDGRIFLSHKELLGSWEQNAAAFEAGQTVSGIVRSIESYGIFVELSPNLAGLAELCQGAHVGQRASVYIKSIIPEKMKIKLIIVDVFDDKSEPDELKYFITSGRLLEWEYSTETARKKIVSVF